MIELNPRLSAFLFALSFYGEDPRNGQADKDMVAQFLKATTYPNPTADGVPWCSAFLVWIYKTVGIKTGANAAAASWLTFGSHVDQPQMGDIVVLGWPVGAVANHHVGLFVREVANGIYILAGNQNNEVDIALWKKADVLEYRRGA